jgi:multidrug efflux system outer membrane protein
MHGFLRLELVPGSTKFSLYAISAASVLTRLPEKSYKSIFSGLMSSQIGVWSYGAQVTQPIFTGGALRGNLKLAESQHQQALISYREAIQHAFGDVSDALIAYQKFHQVRIRQEDSVADLQESVRLSNMRYKGGTTTYLEVLDGQRSLFSAQLTLADARGTEYQSLVQLYRALGGGWQQ